MCHYDHMGQRFGDHAVPASIGMDVIAAHLRTGQDPGKNFRLERNTIFTRKMFIEGCATQNHPRPGHPEKDNLRVGSAAFFDHCRQILLDSIFRHVLKQVIPPMTDYDQIRPVTLEKLREAQPSLSGDFAGYTGIDNAATGNLLQNGGITFLLFGSGSVGKAVTKAENS